jgi:hypothetical protein
VGREGGGERKEEGEGRRRGKEGGGREGERENK